MGTAKKENKILHFSLFLVGAFFLANPSISLLDILPDSLGCLFLYLAIRKIPPTLLYFREAEHCIRSLFWISLSKIPAIFFALTILGINAAERGMLAVLGFVYFVLELLFLLPAFRDLFRGFLYLDERYGITAAGGFPRKNGIYPGEKLLSLTYLVFVLRGVLSFLPECLLLRVQDTLSGGGAVLPTERIYLPVLIVCQVLGYLFMVIWCIPMFRYLDGIRKDPDLLGVLQQEDGKKDDATKAKDRTHYRIRTMLILLAVGVGMNIDLTFDGVNVLPDPLVAVFFLIAFIVIYPYVSRRSMNTALVGGTLYFASSLTTYCLETSFAMQYGASSLHRVVAADRLYRSAVVASFVNAAAAILLYVAVGILLYQLMHRVIGDGDELSYTGRRRVELLGFYRRRMIWFSAIGVLDALVTAFNVFLRQYTESIPASEEVLGTATVILQQFGWFWSVCLLLSFVWLGYTVYQFSGMETELHSRLYTEED